jgi:hypothetical protein
MKKILWLIFLTCLFFLLSIDSFAQRGRIDRGRNNWRIGINCGRMFNSKTLETISGEVVSVDSMIAFRGRQYGLHLMLKTDKENISVHLGPTWFIENFDFKIRSNDKIDVKGSRITFEGKPAIIAMEVKKGDKILKLRDECGIPYWSGWRGR